MAGGWTRDGAVNDQIEADLADALARLKQGQRAASAESPTHCAECEDPIAEARRTALPGTRLCRDCAAERDTRTAPGSTFNRRGSKDSQLK